MEIYKPQTPLTNRRGGVYPLTTADQVVLNNGERLEVNGKLNTNAVQKTGDEMSGTLTITSGDGVKVATDNSTAYYKDKGLYLNGQQAVTVQELFGEKHLTLFEKFVSLSSYGRLYHVGIPCDVGSSTKIYFDMQNRVYQSVTGLVFTRYTVFGIHFGTNETGNITYANLNPLVSTDNATLSYSGTVATYKTSGSWDMFEMIFICSAISQPYPKITYERV